MSVDATSLGERVTDLRIRRGLSQRELAAEVSRSESWVSQVERGLLRVERLPMLQAPADALGVAVKDLRPEASTTTRPGQDEETLSDLDALRLTVTGHPAPSLLLSPPTADDVDVDVDSLSTRVAEAWRLTHAAAFREASANLTKLLPDLEQALRRAKQPNDRKWRGCSRTPTKQLRRCKGRRQHPGGAKRSRDAVCAVRRTTWCVMGRVRE